ncbi:tetraacyldisaccharide 4'-kinase [Henriciella marina]|uniref:tetraacyldisaccharide 4'-kinase n=1 Tax=Henriciella marina TaxID=453851 RepID=UPI000363E3F0|nr:tetraacyldisaccharide 4'-kinase [Henriciella marina]
MMRAPRFWDRDVDPRSREGAPVTRLILTPLSAVYAAVTARRIEKTVPLKLDIPVICIGNLTAGGSGKSPVAAAIRKQLSDQNEQLRIATLSRGYGGKLSGPLRVDAGSHSAAQVGDEALMLAQTGEAWIGADRAAAGRAMQEAGVDIIIMDDGFQNPSLQKTLSLVVVDAQSGFGNGHVIPKGPLREPVENGLARADAVILMGDGDPPHELARFKGPILKARIAPVAPPEVGTYIAFAGIGRPEKFFDTLRACGRPPVDAVPFADHHTYKDSDLRYLRALAADYGATLITTEKDFIRLTPAQRNGISTLPVTAEFESNEALAKLLRSVTEA